MSNFNQTRTMELVDIANSLSNEDVCKLIGMLRHRLFVWTQDNDGVSHCDDVIDACCNGALVQINCVDREDI
jgi:hypothetical protein